MYELNIYFMLENKITFVFFSQVAMPMVNLR